MGQKMLNVDENKIKMIPKSVLRCSCDLPSTSITETNLGTSLLFLGVS